MCTKYYRLYLLTLILSLANPLLADTDDADSLDFESFHAEDKPQQTVKKKPLLSKKNNSDKTHTTSTNYNIQDTLAFLQSQVTLYKVMDYQCPNGWVKTQESFTFIKQQRQLNFSFNCL